MYLLYWHGRQTLMMFNAEKRLFFLFLFWNEGSVNQFNRLSLFQLYSGELKKKKTLCVMLSFLGEVLSWHGMAWPSKL